VEANRRARVPRGRHLVKGLAQQSTFIAFYVGSQDKTFIHANVLLDRTLNAHQVPHLFKVYPGAHATSLWKRWAPQWLGFALDHLSRPTG
jgi:enterochelin esterase-like enzyme